MKVKLLSPTTSVDDKPQITPEPTPNQESQTSPVQPQNSKLSSTEVVGVGE